MLCFILLASEPTTHLLATHYPSVTPNRELSISETLTALTQLYERIKIFKGFINNEVMSALTQQKKDLEHNLDLYDQIANSDTEDMSSEKDLHQIIEIHLKDFQDKVEEAVTQYFSPDRQFLLSIATEDILLKIILPSVPTENQPTLLKLWAKIEEQAQSFEQLIQNFNYSRESLTQIRDLRKNIEMNLNKLKEESKILNTLRSLDHLKVKRPPN
jgi:hypothetical protein